MRHRHEYSLDCGIKMKKLNLENVRVYSGTKGDVKDAMDLIGQAVYVFDDDSGNYYQERLIGVRLVEDDPYAFVGSDFDAYKHFILVKDAKFVGEKKLRPFKDIEEFFKETGLALGETIRYRKKGNRDNIECVVILNGYLTDGQILLGVVYYKVESLYNCFEYYDSDNSEWKPFGIEE